MLARLELPCRFRETEMHLARVTTQHARREAGMRVLLLDRHRDRRENCPRARGPTDVSARADHELRTEPNEELAQPEDGARECGNESPVAPHAIALNRLQRQQ